MKKYFTKTLIIAIFSIVSTTISQGLSEDWKLIFSDENSSIFIEPSKIVEYGNEISVWAIEIFAVPRTSKKNKQFSSIKTHYLFNKMKKRYAEIGAIFYDDKGGIVNRSSKSNFSTGPSAFMTPITSYDSIETIYKETISYLITGEIKVVEKVIEDNPNSSINEPEITEKIETGEKENASDYQILEKPLPSSNVVKDTGIKLNDDEIKEEAMNSSEESWNEIPQIEEKLEIIEKPKYEMNSKLDKFDENDIEASIDIKLPDDVYNSSKERALKNAIFTDGNLYCVQVSSWKTEAYAKRELNKLLKKGFDAFIVSVKPTNKRDIWHRVRVGYFNSLEEAKKAQRETRKK
jgi:cell division septation protein DedD